MTAAFAAARGAITGLLGIVVTFPVTGWLRGAAILPALRIPVLTTLRWRTAP